ncbi:hypothetical protein [Streptomyces anandii]|uniref:Uncharacterized protein n=1 Tax=Streptomyces anandii TaxID=285454 RepID=A0ABW6HCC0_9ACTN
MARSGDGDHRVRPSRPGVTTRHRTAGAVLIPELRLREAQNSGTGEPGASDSLLPTA